jgi:hypothetical protein
MTFVSQGSYPWTDDGDGWVANRLALCETFVSAVGGWGVSLNPSVSVIRRRIGLLCKSSLSHFLSYLEKNID